MATQGSKKGAWIWGAGRAQGRTVTEDQPPPTPSLGATNQVWRRERTEYHPDRAFLLQQLGNEL